VGVLVDAIEWLFSSSGRVRESGRVGEGAREESRLPPIASALSHVNRRAASPHLDTYTFDVRLEKIYELERIFCLTIKSISGPTVR
jgi:hypothetical protein